MRTTTIALLVLCAVLGAAAGHVLPAQAEPAPAIDRALMERLVRAEEAQVHALEVLARVEERCRK